MTRPSRREVMDKSQCFRSAINPEIEIAGMHVGSPRQRSHHNGRSMKPFTVKIHQHWLRCWHPGDRYDGQIVELCPGLAAVSGVDLQNERLLVQPKGKGLFFEPARQPIEVGRGFSRSEGTSHPVKSISPARRKVKRHWIMVAHTSPRSATVGIAAEAVFGDGLGKL
jgi:hypothetical protein